MTEASKDLVRRLFEDVFNEQRLDLSGEILAEEYVEHAVEPFGVREPGQVHGPSHQRRVVEWLRAQLPAPPATREPSASIPGKNPHDKPQKRGRR
jgi:hypothetical protein